MRQNERLLQRSTELQQESSSSALRLGITIAPREERYLWANQQPRILAFVLLWARVLHRPEDHLPSSGAGRMSMHFGKDKMKSA